MENDVGTVKKSRAASPAPKTSKAKEDKEVVKPSPSAEKVPKVEKSSETKTDKVRATAGCLCFLCVLVLGSRFLKTTCALHIVR